MVLSDLAVKRPVFATVVSLILVAFGGISFLGLPLRELPEMDVPVVSIETAYVGASASVVETRITQVLEDQLAGVEGIDQISSTSEDGVSRISIEFKISRDIDDAANDVRDAVSRVVARLPDEADPPRVRKQDSDARPIMWFNFNSDRLTNLELNDYAERYIVDRLSVLDGVARVRLSGGSRYAMRIWLDRVALAARGLTVTDIEEALQNENIELPAGNLESQAKDFTVRILRSYRAEEDFRKLVVGQGPDGHLIRLEEVARVSLEASERRTMFRGNGEPQVSLGIVKQSTANLIDVARAANAEVAAINKTLPEGARINNSSDDSVFVDRAISEVYTTLTLALLLVVAVIFVFLGSMRASVIPAVVVPICLISTFSVLAALGMSINLITLLALILCIGLVVDDSIVVLENIQRRIDLGEPPLLAAYRGARQVGFAVIATTIVIVAVFTPLIFLEGFVGRIFGELAATVAAAVIISSLVALTLSVVMCSKLLRQRRSETRFQQRIEGGVGFLRDGYSQLLKAALKVPAAAVVFVLVLSGIVVALWTTLPKELEPPEDRGKFFVSARAAEGTNYDEMITYIDEIESVFMDYVENGEAQRVLLRAPGSFGASSAYNSARGVFVLTDWDDRERTGREIMGEVNSRLGQIAGLETFAIMGSGISPSWGQPVQFVLSGANYEQLEDWAQVVIDKAEQNPGLIRVRTDYKPTRPQILVSPDLDRTFDLGVSGRSIGLTLQTMLGSRQVTTFVEGGEEYDVILQLSDENRREPSDLANIYVRSEQTGKLIPLSNLVNLQEKADTASRQRFNRLRSITVSANLNEDYSMGEALNFLETVVAEDLNSEPRIDYKGNSRRFVEQGSSSMFVFALALLIVFLVLAAQFESFIHPLVIILTVPIAICGALYGLYVSGNSLNLFSQIGLIILVGIAAKNGILIVEFANQLRDQGRAFEEALIEAAETRFRPIVMTGLSTSIGALPLVLASGPGSGSRATVGIAIFSGVLLATAMTLFIVPMFYKLLARNTGSPGLIARRLSQYEEAETRGPAVPAE